MTTFSRRTITRDPITGASTEVTSEISGSAIQVQGDPQRYAAQSLSLETMPTLLFSSDDYEIDNWSVDFVRPGDTVEWAGAVYTARDVNVLGPDGKSIHARIVIGR